MTHEALWNRVPLELPQVEKVDFLVVRVEEIVNGLAGRDWIRFEVCVSFHIQRLVPPVHVDCAFLRGKILELILSANLFFIRVRYQQVCPQSADSHDLFSLLHVFAEHDNSTAPFNELQLG
jgi:hypothetical protein